MDKKNETVIDRDDASYHNGFTKGCEDLEDVKRKLAIAIEAMESVEYECPNCTPALKSIIGKALEKIRK